MNRRAMIVVLAATASLGLASCGDDDKDERLSKSELADKADKICETAKNASREVTAPEDLLTDPKAAEAYFDKIVPITQKQTDDLAALKPAQEIQTDWNQFVNSQKQANATLKIIRDKAEAKDPTGVRDLAKSQRVREKFAAEAEVIGASTCAEQG